MQKVTEDREHGFLLRGSQEYPWKGLLLQKKFIPLDNYFLSMLQEEDERVWMTW